MGSVSVAGGLGGTTFDSVTSNMAFLDPSLSYDANNVFLTLTRNDVSFSSVADTPNQTGVARVLDSNQSALSDIANSLLVLSAPETRKAFDSLSGIQHGGPPMVMQRQNNGFMILLSNRLGGVSHTRPVGANPPPGMLLACNGSDWPAMVSAAQGWFSGPKPETRRGFWIQAYHQFGDIEDTFNATGYEYKLSGTALGMDKQLNTGLTMGAALSIGSSDVSAPGYNSDVTSYQLAAYSGWEQKGYYLDGLISAGFTTEGPDRIFYEHSRIHRYQLIFRPALSFCAW